MFEGRSRVDRPESSQDSGLDAAVTGSKRRRTVSLKDRADPRWGELQSNVRTDALYTLVRPRLKRVAG